VKFKGSFVAGHGIAIAKLPLLTQGVNVPSTGSGSLDSVASSTNKQLDEGMLISKDLYIMSHRRERNLTASRAVDSVTCTQRKADIVPDNMKVPRRELTPQIQV
jgi:hypothetical protein